MNMGVLIFSEMSRLCVQFDGVNHIAMRYAGSNRVGIGVTLLLCLTNALEYVSIPAILKRFGVRCIRIPTGYNTDKISSFRVGRLKRKDVLPQVRMNIFSLIGVP